MADAGTWTVRGDVFGRVYHGGRAKVEKPSFDALQRRDHGFYGRGFYVSSSPSYARTYGPRITTFEFQPWARILRSALHAEQAPAGLPEAVVSHIYQSDVGKATARGKEAAFREWVKEIPSSPLEWKNAVDRYGEDLGFDAIAHSGGEIVVKNLDSLRLI